MKLTKEFFVVVLSPSIANSEVLISKFNEIYPTSHSIIPFIFPPSIVVHVSNIPFSLSKIDFPSLMDEVSFSNSTYENNSLFLSSNDSFFIQWYESIQELCGSSIDDEVLFPYPGFLLGNEGMNPLNITLTNKEWRIASYKMRYSIEEKRVTSFYREKREDIHLI
ncbi:MAG: hypothetical protein EOM67_10715 [Spirochaetia bacterium]|nr:hypothetical protein [Spirochaetia bacterium]